ncbi:hypothetical protein BS78_03G329400 [Paspalum vaginatum]|nr:hypothetical protein BS78_03G329400 [Paspalum vaginatum]
MYHVCTSLLVAWLKYTYAFVDRSSCRRRRSISAAETDGDFQIQRPMLKPATAHSYHSTTRCMYASIECIHTRDQYRSQVRTLAADRAMAATDEKIRNGTRMPGSSPSVSPRGGRGGAGAAVVRRRPPRSAARARRQKRERRNLGWPGLAWSDLSRSADRARTATARRSTRPPPPAARTGTTTSSIFLLTCYSDLYCKPSFRQPH